MSDLADILSSLRKYQQIIVTGPQRTGTTIAAKILAYELDYRFFPEEHVGFDEVGQLFELYRIQQRFVLQAPCLCPYVHLLPGAVVIMRRPLEEILRSQARIGWPEKDELDRYFTTQGPVAQVKYDAWDRFQKARLRGRGFDLDYRSLRGHALWIEETQRKSFGPRQITPSTNQDTPRGAVRRLQAALRQTPNDPEAYYRLGLAQAKQRRDEEAVLCLKQAVRFKPDFAEAHKELANLLRERQDTAVDEAISSYQAAIRHRPDDADAHHMLGRTLKDMGLLDEAVSALRRACQLRPDSAKYHSSLLYCLHYHPDSDSEILTQEHERWNQRHAEPLAPLIQPHANDRDPNRRLRIGYVSPYFRNHPVGRFLLPLFEANDRRNFEIYCYSFIRAAEGLTPRFRVPSDCWHDVRGKTDEELADLIRRDRIDILVDLDAHTSTNRLLAFARKPAPVQVTYLAYCSTTGLRTMDYRLTDPYLDPPGQPACYAEETVWLPETYWCYLPLADLPPVGPLPALVNNHVTFGCLNNFWKVTLPTLTAWRELLQVIPGSRLLLHARPGAHRDRVRTFFAERGIEPGRIEFVGVTPPAQYFERYSQIDIGLDPFPYPGGTTTCDALWMGVPVVSLPGKTAVSRGGLSILSNVGLPELVAHTPEDYVRLAADLAADLPRLAALRAGMRDRMLRSPLTDAPRFARNVETAFRTMWQRWCSKATGGDAGRVLECNGSLPFAVQARS